MFWADKNLTINLYTLKADQLRFAWKMTKTKNSLILTNWMWYQHYCFQTPLFKKKRGEKKKRERESFHIWGFYCENWHNISFCSVMLSIFTSFFKTTCRAICFPQKNVIIFDSYCNSLITSYIFLTTHPPKQPQDFAYGSQPTNWFDCSAWPASLTGNFTVARISQYTSAHPQTKKYDRIQIWPDDLTYFF